MGSHLLGSFVMVYEVSDRTAQLSRVVPWLVSYNALPLSERVSLCERERALQKTVEYGERV